MKKLVVSLFVVLTAAAASARPLAVHAFPGPMSSELVSAIRDAAAKYRLDPNFIAATAFKESAFNPSAVSRRGAQGIMQLMPKTARALGVRDSFDVRQNVFGGAKYLRELLDRFAGDSEKALAAYNLGPKRIEKEGPRATPGVIQYVSHIKAYYARAL
jgi:soluble lytic murein transglycosylase-like protein